MIAALISLSALLAALVGGLVLIERASKASGADIEQQRQQVEQYAAGQRSGWIA